MDDQTDLAAVDTAVADTSSDAGASTLSDLANSAFGSIISSVGASTAKGLGSVVSQALTPSPDLAAKAATPGAVKKIAVGSVALPIILVGGAVAAYILLGRR